MNRRTLPAIFLAALLLLPGSRFARADEGGMDRSVLAPTFVVIDASDPETLIYAKNPDKQVAPASTTKIMTCILAIEHAESLDEIVTVPTVATRLKSTNTLMGLKNGEALPLRDMLYGLMLPSGNDAAIALAYHVAGDVEQFAELMNAKAAELGMTETHFVNASGVYKGQHYSTARDMARLAAYAMQNETFREIVKTAEYTVPANEVRKNELHLVNTNRLVSDPKDSKFFYEYAVGIKTGSTAKGGKCLVAAAEKDGVTLIAVLLGVTEGGDRSTRIRRCFSDAKMLFENIYETLYTPVTPETLGLDLYEQQISVENSRLTDPEGGKLTLSVRFDPDAQCLLRADTVEAIRSDPAQLTVETDFASESVTAPVQAGDVLGTVTFHYRGKLLYTGELTASRSVEAYDPTDAATPVPSETPQPVASSALSGHLSGPSSGHLSAWVLLGLIVITLVLLVLLVVLLVRRRGKAARSKRRRKAQRK